MSERPLILISNDDGVHAPGIQVLAEIADNFGDVVVCAPDREQSGMSHAISLRTALRLDRVDEGWYAVSGTPVDCVYLACFHLLPRTPDVVLSGINRGYNLGADTFYSGTVAAAREGFFRGASALAVSVEGDGEAADAIPAVHEVLPLLLETHGKGERQLLNLNVPAGGAGKPIRVAPLGARRYADQVDERNDLMGQPYYWIGGPPVDADEKQGGDTAVVASGDVALTPLTVTATGDLETWAKRVRR